MQDYLRFEVPFVKILLAFRSAENQQTVLIHERFCMTNKKINYSCVLKAQPIKDDKY